MAYLNSITKIIKQIQDSDEDTRDRYNYHRGLSLYMIKKLMGADHSQWGYINNALKSGVNKGKLIKTGGKYRVAVTKKKSRKLRKCKHGRDRSTGKCRKKSAKRKSSRKRRSAKRKSSRKRRSAKKKTSRKRRSAKSKKKLKFRNGKKAFIDTYFTRSSTGPEVGMVEIKKIIDQYKTAKSFSGKQILPVSYKGLKIIGPDLEDLCEHPRLFAEFIYRLQTGMHDSALVSSKMEKLYRNLEKLYMKCKLGK